MSDIEQIQAILDARREQTPRVDLLTRSVDSVRERGRLAAALLHRLRAQVATPLPVVDNIDERFRAAADSLGVVRRRMMRDTINLGVSGQARVGKSTFLQSISGLGDDQIPTGSGLPVTAVRSRIFNDAARGEALISFHSWDSFRGGVLRPFHREAGLPEPPLSMEGFASFTYPQADANHSRDVLLQRLRDMQASLPSYRSLLNGAEVPVDLGQLRGYVAYPKEGVGSGATRSYLAVREVRIFTRFPNVDTVKLGLIDLPGLGEVTADAERRHVDELRHEVDLVLMVKRPTETAAFWRQEDARALDLLDEARDTSPRRSFVLLIVNDGQASPQLLEALLGDIRRKINEGRDDQNIRVLQGDLIDRSAVQGPLLKEILSHLAKHLPEMDRLAFEAARGETFKAARAVHGQMVELEAALKALSPQLDDDAVERARELRLDLAAELSELEANLALHDRSGEDQGFVQAVEQQYGAIMDWVAAGMGRGVEDWKKQAIKRIHQDKGSASLSGDELNRIRVEISHFFSGLDQYLESQVASTLAQVVEVLSRRLGVALGEGSPRERLLRLRALLSMASRPLPNLERAVDDLLALQFSYRAQIHPRVREQLESLNPTDNSRGAPENTVPAVAPTDAGVTWLLKHLAERAEEAAFNTRKAVLEEARLPYRVQFAAVEQFTDALIRSGESEREFRYFVTEFRDLLWPDATDAGRVRSQDYAGLRRGCRELVTELERLLTAEGS